MMRKMAKRATDIVFSLAGLILLSPLFIVIILILKIKMPDGPVFFIQERIGQFGRPFKMIKFRTMVKDHSGVSVSVRGESRITKTGAILRTYKIDELPEFINVLMGQMSLVGPRPDVAGFADKLMGEERKILELKPGITGPATLVYANEEEILATVADPVKYNEEVIYPNKVRINLEYYFYNSFWGDIRIILRTFFFKK
jgi:lipopolysaccharide/colanic/teichoic acid biosynthesis glycosyltransferase